LFETLQSMRHSVRTFFWFLIQSLWRQQQHHTSLWIFKGMGQVQQCGILLDPPF